MKVGLWSTTPGSNNATPPDGWPEGQAPSTINDCAREMMAAIRTYATDAQYFDTGNTPSFLTTTTFSLNTADATTFHVGRRVKLYDATTLYGTINSVSATFVSVRLDSGALTASLTSVAVAAVGDMNSSLPEDSGKRRNGFINGSLDIWQRGNSFSPANNATTYTADRFLWLQSASCAVNVTRAERSANSANVPSIAQAGMFLNSSLRVSVSAVDAALAAGEFAILSYRMEGYDWRQYAHRPNVVSFWANSNRSGIYCVAVRNSPFSASFVQAYTLDTVNTWQRFTITVPEAPTTVSWNYSQSIGCEVSFCLGAGSTYQGGAGNWTAASILANSSQQNFVASAGNVFMLAGLQFEAGTRATPLEVRPYGTELALCQRYYWRGLPVTSLNFPAYTAGCVMSWPVKLPVTMRTTPTMSMSAPGMTTAGLAGSPTLSGATPDGFRIIASSDAAHVNSSFGFVSTDFFEADAEL